MSISSSERRLIENEMIFRRTNEKVVDKLDVLDEMLIEDGHFDLMRDENLKLHFFCECSDENCTSRIPMTLTKYQDIHVDKKVFIVKPGHQVENIERVLKNTQDYSVVKKNKILETVPSTLNHTNVNNG